MRELRAKARTTLSSLTWFLLAASFAGLCGCQREHTVFPPPGSSADRPVVAVPSPPVRDVGETPPSDADARAFAASFDKTVASRNVAAINAAFDFEALVRRAMKGVDLPEYALRRMAEGCRRDLSGPHGLASGLAEWITRGGRHRLLHVHRQADEQRAMYRRDTRDGMVSETVNRFLSWVIAPVGKTHDAGRGPANDREQIAAAFREMNAQFKSGKYQDAWDVYHRLPDRLQHDKLLLMLWVRTASHVKGKLYDEAIRAYREQYPEEPNIDLIMIDAYYAHQQYDLVLKCIDGLDRTVCGDPYLDALRADAYLAKGDLAAAKRYAQKSIEGEPDLPKAYLDLLTISLKQKDFSQTSAILTVLRDKFPWKMPALKGDPLYAEYVASPQYQTWAAKKK
jgi:tetratricopeptide (TPR) repeat protein